MTKKDNKTILIISEDDTIIENLKNFFSDCNVVCFDGKNKINENFDVVVLDDFKVNANILKEILNDFVVINISKNNIKEAINIARPFNIRTLMNTISDIFEKNKKTLKFKDFEIYNSSLVYNGKEIIFGNKEIALINYLYKNNNSLKENTLKDVWGYDEVMETRVLENTVNKIRNKFKDISIDNFIIFEDGKYKINKIYLN